MTVVLTDTIDRYVGLAADTKPTSPRAGSEFYETDSGGTYIYSGSAWALKAAGTFAILDQIVTILGGTKMAFYPLLTPVGGDVFPYGTGNDGLVGIPSDESGVMLLEAEFDPIPLAGGVYAYYFDNSGNNHIVCADDAAYTHGNGSADTAFSMGAWIYPTEALGSVRTIIAKFGTTAATSEEYDFRFDASGNLVLELHDPSVPATETGTGASDVLVPFAWNFVTATYDGAQGGPDVHLYRNASDTLAAGTTIESGEYAAMEDTGSEFMIGARDASGTPKQEFEGYMALPFITGKELTQANVSSLYALGQQLIGAA